MIRTIAPFHFLSATALGLGVFLAGAASAAEPDPPAPAIRIVNSANSALAITTIEPQIDWPLVLQRNDTAAGDAVASIDVTDLLSVSGRPQQVTLQNKNGSAHDGNLTLPAGGQVALRMLAQVPEEGAHTGEIGIVIAGKRTAIKLTVTRTVREVVVMGATGGALQVNTPDPGLKLPIVIRRNDNAAGPRNIGIELGNLIAPSGQVARLELRDGDATVGAGTPIGLAPLGQKTLILVGKLTEDGLHNGEIGLVVDGKRLSTALKITRNVKESAVRIEDIAQTHTTIDAAGVDIRLRIQEAEGQETTVDLPTLAKLDRKQGNGLIQANYRELKVFDRGTPLTPTGSLALAPRKTLDLLLQIEGLTTPGNYTGVLRVSSPTRKPADKTFELSLRRGIACAIVLILVGVLLSTAARAYYTFGRSAMLAQGDAITVRDDLEHFRAITLDLTASEQRVLSYFLARLETIRRGSVDLRLGKPDVQLGEIRRKVAVFFLWIDLRRKIESVKTPSIADAQRPKLIEIMAVLEKDGAPQADTEQAATAARTAMSTIDEAVKNQLKAAIAALQAEISGLSDPQRLALQETSGSLVAAVTDADDLKLQSAEAKLNAARHAYVQVAIKGLQDRLDPARPASGFTRASWTALVEDYNRRLDVLAAEHDADTKVREWNKLRVEWLRAVAQALLHQIEADDEVAANTQQPATPGPAAPDPKAARAKYAEATTALQSIDRLLLDRKFRDANNAYATAAKAHSDGLKAMQVTARVAAVAGQAPAPTDGGAVPDGVIQGAWNAISFVLRPPTSVAQANRRVLIAEALLFLLMLALALGAGLKLLYFDNAAWGAPIDLLVAFLWGFGLHQVGGTAFHGVQSIAQQIAGK